MKVNETQGAPEMKPQAPAESAPQPKRKQFDRVLEEKSGAKTQKSPGQLDDASMAAAALLSNPRSAVMEVRGKGPAAGAEALPLQQLAHEITAVVAPGGKQSVDIQFDSRVLDGLRVRVTGERDGVSIRFNAASQDTASLLSRNVDQLTQALQSRGVTVAAIDIQQAVPAVRAAAEPSRPSRESESESGGGRDSDSQRQGGGQNRRQ